jgi:hypothetical protein
MYVKDFLEQWQTCACHWHLAKSLININENKHTVTPEDFMIIESLKENFSKKYPETQFNMWSLTEVPENKKIKEMFWYLCFGDCPHIIPILLEKLEEHNIAPAGKNALKTLNPFINIINPFYELPEFKLTPKGIKITHKKYKKIIETHIMNHMELLNTSKN